MRYFLHLAYQGQKYRGWQRQTGVKSVQEKIEESLSRMMKIPLKIHGCGRTDAGVHALQYFAHTDLPEEIDFDPVERINYVLPDDVAVYEFIPLGGRHNAQTDAIARSYEYYIHLRKTPIIKDTSALYHIDELDFDKMNLAVEILRNTRDFRSLCKSPDIYKHTNCNVQQVSLETNNGGTRLKFTITANRFLRSMIRYIVARLLEIGSGELSIEHFEDIVSNQKDFEWPHNKQAHAHGLYLSHVIYPYLERDTVRF